eukprot:7997419-Pyramimonas_sp.AAC.1
MKSHSASSLTLPRRLIDGRTVLPGFSQALRSRHESTTPSHHVRSCRNSCARQHCARLRLRSAAPA